MSFLYATKTNFLPLNQNVFLLCDQNTFSAPNQIMFSHATKTNFLPVNERIFFMQVNKLI